MQNSICPIPRKVPRIMSRIKPKIEESADPSNPKEAAGIVTSEELSKELIGEKVVVRDGVVVAVQHSNPKNGLVSGILDASAKSGGRRVIIETGGGNVYDAETYSENPLPGVADEVESYPCKFCPEQVFLTSYGLERHARKEHRENFAEISDYIKTIQNEWNRRERERTRLRERAEMTKLRQERIANAAVRNTALRGMMSAEEVEVGQEVTDPAEQRGPERFEACRICSLLVNARHPTAMENHLRAHKKNDELRLQLLAEYGAEIVSRLTCHECHLVFTDETKLMVHVEHTHIRRRKYVCKWCGHIATTMSDLNIHKADVHAMPAAQSRADRLIMMRHNMQRKMNQDEPSTSNAGGPNGYNKTQGRPRDDVLCRTSCEECGLKLVRPSLLIRHMLRVHSKEMFSCEIETSGLPSYRIDVERGRIVWSCCDVKYTDRQEFLFHRRNEHLEKMVVAHATKPAEITPNDRILEMATAAIPMQNAATYSGEIVHDIDGNMQVVLPDGIDTSGDIFVVMMDENDESKPMGLDFENSHNLEVGEQPQHEHHHQQQLEVHVPIGEEGDGGMTLSEETYQQLRAQFGDELNNMQIVFVNEEDELNEVTHGEQLAVEQDDMHSHLNNHPMQHPDLTNEEIFEP